MSAPFLVRSPTRTSAAYGRIQELLATETCVVLDGGVATQLNGFDRERPPHQDEALWGAWALYDAPDAVLEVHDRYLRAGADIISTNTWGVHGALAPGLAARAPADWPEVARRGVRLGRKAIDSAGLKGQVALAFSINGDVDSPERREAFELLIRTFEDDPPDLVLLETMSLVREGLTMPAIETIVGSGLPVWLSFRRCLHGVCGVFGQHWGGPEGDLFGRAAKRFEELGVGALLINCLPPDHVSGMVPWLRDFTDLPLGVYPNLGYYTDSGWSFDKSVGRADYGRMAREWRAEGAQIVGGCCGVRPEHIAGAREALAGTKPGDPSRRSIEGARTGADGQPKRTHRWLDRTGDDLYPIPFPRLMCEPGVFVPTQGSFLAWKYLMLTGAGHGLRCLDIGCGTGLLSVQLALNGAEHVHAIDLSEDAVACTLSNAFRNGVAERVTGAQIDLYPWVPQERYDLIVASLYQTPVDPSEQTSSHRPLDYWGRNLVDHLLTHLPDALADQGVAYVMQLSILSQARTAELAEASGLRSRVVDFAFFEFSEMFRERKSQIDRVEELSDAYHLRLDREHDVMVAYLVEITHTAAGEGGEQFPLPATTPPC